MPRLLCQDRRKLEGAAPGADDADSLAAQIVFMLPASAVKRRAGKAVCALDRRQIGPVELPDGADDRVGGVGLRLVVVSDRDLPAAAGFIKACFGHFGLETDVLPQLEVSGGVGKVLSQDGLRRKMLRPVFGPEGIGVGMVGAIDPAAGIGVLVPGATDVAVFLDDLERDPCFFEADCRQQPGHASANDQHLKFGAGRLGNVEYFRLQVGILAVHRELFGEELDVVLLSVLANQKLQHFQQVIALRFERRAGAVSMSDDHGQRLLQDALAVGFANAVVRGHELDLRTDRATYDVHIPGQVNHRQHDRCGIRLRQGFADLVVGLGDGCQLLGYGFHRPSPLLEISVANRLLLRGYLPGRQVS